MNNEPFENLPDVLDAPQLAQALRISKAGAYILLGQPKFPTLHIGKRKLVMKNDFVQWFKNQANPVQKNEKERKQNHDD